MKKGEIVIKIIEGGGTRTASIKRIKRARNDIVWTGSGTESDDVDAYSALSGEAMENFIPGFRSYLVALDGGVEDEIKPELVD